ncbi:DUF3558 family protein [Amycolatopsis oliviviridis]|nr:DUF3558 family protein [Amycolatopsis oliviviridis]
MKKLFLLPLAAAALVVAGCSGEKPGVPTPALTAPSSAPQSQASSSAPTTGGADTASIDPCSLLAQADLTSYGTFKAPEKDEAGGARVCRFARERASASDESLTVSVGIRDSQGLDSVSDAGNGKTSGNVNGRKAVLVPTPPEACVMALEVSGSARVDVVSVSTDPEKACGIAEKVADTVEPKLPKA